MVAGGSPGYDMLFSCPRTNSANQTKRVSGATLTTAGRDSYGLYYFVSSDSYYHLCGRGVAHPNHHLNGKCFGGEGHEDEG
jgi:hypothetical protein